MLFSKLVISSEEKSSSQEMEDLNFFGVRLDRGVKVEC
jgi:hypothetical protein